MFKILRLRAILSPLTWIVLYSFVAMISGCYYFKVTRSAAPPGDAINKMQFGNKFIILHLNDEVWHFTGIMVNEDSATGIITELKGHDRYRTAKPDAANRYLKRAWSDQSYILNEVHIYTTGYEEKGNGKISVPIKDIQKIEIYDKDKGATAASWIFSSLGVGAGAFGILLIVVALTKSSCPFVYAYNDDDFYFTGEIFSGATQPGLERDDYLQLQCITPSGDSCSLKLTNEVHEIQSVNFTGLVCIDHPANLSVLIDKYGITNTYLKTSPPVVAINGAGKNILSVIETRDTINYSGDEKSVGREGIEQIVLKFLKPHNCRSGKLVIRAKNSFWLDILFTKFHNLFGAGYNNFTEKQESVSGEKLKKFLMDQNIPLSVYVEKNGKWQYTDCFNIAGPMALRDDILPLDLTGINSDTFRIKLETGFLFWEVDYAGMDFSKNESVSHSEITAFRATDNNGVDVMDKIRTKDKNYLVLKEVGDEVHLEFKAPARQSAGRTLFLHSSGYYKIIRDQSGPSDKKALKRFRKPNRFPEFSKETYDLLTSK